MSRPFDFVAIYREARQRFMADVTNPVDIDKTIAKVAFEHGATALESLLAEKREIHAGWSREAVNWKNERESLLKRVEELEALVRDTREAFGRMDEVFAAAGATAAQAATVCLFARMDATLQKGDPSENQLKEPGGPHIVDEIGRADPLYSSTRKEP